MVTAPKLTSSLRAGTAFLRQAQGSDGGFSGEASPDPRDFSRVRHHPTVFFTALILTCLQEVPGTVVLRRRAAVFLLRHKSPQWSWNYWMRGDEAAGQRSYPDDLDDTACALAALGLQDATLVDGTVLAEVAKQLIATEVAPGGPYTTWLVGPDATAVWQDVDIAVNANIGFLLSLHGVQLPGLERYVADALERQTLTSPYYVGVAPVLYFLARWYRGAQLEKLRQTVRTELEDPRQQDNPLTQALLITAALRLDIAPAALAPAVQRLLASQTDGAWPAAALYFEPPVEGVLHYAGSAALTTAFGVEALAAYRRRLGRPATTLPRPADNLQTVTVNQALAGSEELAPDLRRLYRAQIERLVAGDRDHQIAGMATTVAAACGIVIDSETLLRLNTGSVEGWVAYTIYDDFWDREGEPMLLGVANVALRWTTASFCAALPDNRGFHRLVDRTLAGVDGANTWEAVHAQATVQRGVVKLATVPDYGDYTQLAQRSWGHMLAATGVLVAAGCVLDSPEVQQLQRFFHHFLIARQLNDDAHDWEEDLVQGRITAVAALLLGGHGGGSQRVELKRQRAELQLRFWESTILEVTALIQSHLDAARQARSGCRVMRDPAPLEGWLGAIERSTQQALAGRAEARKFIATYRQEL